MLFDDGVLGGDGVLLVHAASLTLEFSEFS